MENSNSRHGHGGHTVFDVHEQKPSQNIEQFEKPISSLFEILFQTYNAVKKLKFNEIELNPQID